MWQQYHENCWSLISFVMEIWCLIGGNWLTETSERKRSGGHPAPGSCLLLIEALGAGVGIRSREVCEVFYNAARLPMWGGRLHPITSLNPLL